MTQSARRVVAGFKVPTTAPVSDNEMLWIDMLRLIFHDRVPVPKLPLVQALREAARRPS